MKDQQGKILQAAQEIFGKYGLKKSSMSDIAMAAGMGKASIYHYFASKEHLFAAVIEQEIMRFWLKVTRGLFRMAGKPDAKLKAFFIARMKYVSEFENANNAFRDQNIQNLKLINQLKEQTETREGDFVKNILVEGNELGIFEVENPDRAASMIITAIRGFEYPWVTSVPDEKYEKDVGSMIDLILDGIRRR